MKRESSRVSGVGPFVRAVGLVLVGVLLLVAGPARASGPTPGRMGSEERGVSNALLKDADGWVSIPMKGTISSLNVSVAAGIMLFEVLRQRSAQVYSSGS